MDGSWAEKGAKKLVERGSDIGVAVLADAWSSETTIEAEWMKSERGDWQVLHRKTAADRERLDSEPGSRPWELLPQGAQWT